MAASRTPGPRRRGLAGANPVVVGAVTLAIAVVLTYLGFAKGIPFHESGTEVRAVFEQANSIRPNSPVRIAGVTVGKVTGVERQDGTDAAVVTMRLQDQGLPVHRDARAKIRPRIFLEGNFFVDLQPGTPGSPELEAGGTIPVTRTATPVQLDQVLTALQSDSREDLQQLLDGYGTALTYEPTGADDRDQDPAVRGETAAESLNDAFEDGPAALRGTAIVNDALLGTRPRDLSRLIAGLGEVTTTLARDERALSSLVTGFRRTVGALASRQDDLRTTVALLPGTLRATRGALASVDAALPPTRELARDLVPGTKETPATIAAAFPWIEQTRRLLGQDELRGLAQRLSPATRDLATVVDRSVPLLPQAGLVSQCLTEVVLPTGDVKIDEGPLSTGVENFKEFWYTMVGLAGESQNFDGNGQYVRFQVGGGTQTVSTGQISGESLFGNAVAQPLGTRPAYPGKRPPYVSDRPCKDQTRPDLNGPAAAPRLARAAGPTGASSGAGAGAVAATRGRAK